MFVGDAFLLPPRVVHSTHVREGGNIICCEFYMESLFPDNANAFDRVRQITQNFSFTMLFQRELYNTQPKFTFSRKGQRLVEKLMHSMLEEYTQAEELFTDYLHLQILELLLTFAREYSQSPAHEVSEKVYDKYRSMVENAIHFIDQHYNEPLTLNSVYTRSGQNSTPNSNATNLHSSQKRCCSFCISSSNASPTFQVQKSIFHQMTKPIQVTVILPLLLAISFSRNDDIHSSISGISNDLIGVIPTIGQ